MAITAPTTTGELSTFPRVLNDQISSLFAFFTQCSFLSRPPNTTRSCVNAGEEKYGNARSLNFHSIAPFSKSAHKNSFS